MILILEGIVFRINEMAKLAIAITNITDKAMTRVGCICVVTAKAEQIPSTCMVIGLLSTSGSVTILFLLLEKNPLPAFY